MKPQKRIGLLSFALSLTFAPNVFAQSEELTRNEIYEIEQFVNSFSGDIPAIIERSAEDADRVSESQIPNLLALSYSVGKAGTDEKIERVCLIPQKTRENCSRSQMRVTNADGSMKLIGSIFEMSVLPKEAMIQKLTAATVRKKSWRLFRSEAGLVATIGAWGGIMGAVFSHPAVVIGSFGAAAGSFLFVWTRNEIVKWKPNQQDRNFRRSIEALTNEIQSSKRDPLPDGRTILRMKSQSYKILLRTIESEF